MMSAIEALTTVIVTTFDRPEVCQRCIASIRARYPHIKIKVADNGYVKPKLPPDVDYIRLPYDSGLSASRNAGVAAATTPYIVICDDDFMWTNETRIEDLRAVLDHNPRVGIACGATWDKGLCLTWAQFLVRVGDEIVGVSATTRKPERTGNINYWISHTGQNFFLARRDALLPETGMPWDERLKIIEHAKWSWDLLQQGRWLLTIVPSVRVEHDRTGRTDHYNAKRLDRSNEYDRLACSIMGVKRCRTIRWWDSQAPTTSNQTKSTHSLPNVVVITPGHTGSSLFAAMLAKLGWNLPPDCDQWNESPSLRNALTSTEDFAEILFEFPQPWAIKDPRFAAHWSVVQPAVLQYNPVVVSLAKDDNSVIDSYARRMEERGKAAAIAMGRIRSCARAYAMWPHKKMQLNFDQILAACDLVDKSRIGAGLDGHKEQTQ